MQTNATNPKKKFTQPLPDAGYVPPDSTSPTNATWTAGSTTVKPVATVTTTSKPATTPATTVNPIATNIPSVQTQTPQASTTMNEMNSFIQEQSKTTMAQPEKDAFEAAKTMDELNAGIKYNQAQADIHGEEEQRLKLYRDTTKALERWSEDFTNTMRRSVMDMTNLQNQNANMVHNLTFARNGAEYGASIKGIQAVNTVLAQAQNELQQARFESDINMRRLGEDYSQQVIEMTRGLYRNIGEARLKMYETMTKMQLQGKLEETRDIRHAQQMLADQYTKDLKLYMDTHAQSAQFAFQKYQYDKQQSMQERQLSMNGIELIKQADWSILQYDKVNQKFINTSPLEAFASSKFGIADDGKGWIRVNVNSAADFKKDANGNPRSQCGQYTNDALGTNFVDLIADKKAMINSMAPVPWAAFVMEFPNADPNSPAGKYGHVWVVENVGVENGKRYIDISDANYDGKWWFSRRRIYEWSGEWNTIAWFHIPPAAQKMAETAAAQKAVNTKIKKWAVPTGENSVLVRQLENQLNNLKTIKKRLLSCFNRMKQSARQSVCTQHIYWWEGWSFMKG